MIQRADYEAVYELLKQPQPAEQTQCCLCCSCGPKWSPWARYLCIGCVVVVVAGLAAGGYFLWNALRPLNLTTVDASPLVAASNVVACPWGGYVPLNGSSTALLLPAALGRVSEASSDAPAVLVLLSDSVTLCWPPANASAAAAVARSSSTPPEYFVEAATFWPGGQGPATWSVVAGPTNLTHATVAGLLPATRVGLRVRQGSGDGNRTSPARNVTTPNHGACGDAADVDAFHEHWDTLQHQIQGCLIGCIFNPDKETCALRCVEQTIGFSSACSACWVSMGQCAADECLGPCLDPSSAKCKQCTKDKCFPDAVTCTGIPMSRFPGV